MVLGAHCSISILKLVNDRAFSPDGRHGPARMGMEVVHTAGSHCTE